MIATHYGLKYSISKYRELTKTNRNGTNLYGLVDGAKKIGLNADALSGNFDELISGIHQNQIKLPFIAHIANEDGMYHYVVVYAIKQNTIFVADPDAGRIKYSLESFAEIWNGYIVTFGKNENFTAGNYTKGSFKKFFNLLQGQYKILVIVIIMSLIISIIGITGAFVFETVIDNFYISTQSDICTDDCNEEHEHIIADNSLNETNILEKIVAFISDNSSNFNLFFILLIALYILQAIIQFFRGYLMSLLSKKIDVKLMLSYYNHVIDLPISSANTRNTGEYISRFSDASTIRSAVSGATLTLLLDSIMVIGCSIILFLENKILFLISLIMVALYALIMLFYRRPIENINRKVMENNARVQSFLKESIDGIETIKSHQAEAHIKDKNTSKFNKLVNSVFVNSIISTSQDCVCDFIELCGTIVILWVGFGMVLNGSVSIGSLITFYALLSYFIEPIKNLIGLQPMIQTAIVAAERLNDILDINAESLNNNSRTLFCEKVEFRGVNFRYGNNELTLKNISLQINKGEKVAIVGESGSGKTTLAKLLMRFYPIESGEILVDGTNINDLELSELRSSISYVDQNTFLFSDTIKNNLLLGNPCSTDDNIKTVCKFSHADKFINSLPFKYDTFLDENGHNLSGGQKQRLAIARALLKNPKLLVLDEATSNLDTVTENGIKDTIFELDKNLTCIIIAHRLNTIINCDRIIVMDEGKIVEEGTHDELIKSKGKYYTLYRKQ